MEYDNSVENVDNVVRLGWSVEFVNCILFIVDWYVICVVSGSGWGYIFVLIIFIK